ncbi:MAG TPA: M20/M25/M40 family metallo-hydrolase [Planctomycetota bacterium]|nr:M20/M25/M40 family metallo-hydrolase [Planctomycetota bacterium]
MIRLSILALLLAGCAGSQVKSVSDRIVQEAAGNDGALKKLVELCDDVGHRLSGSKGLERAVEWAVATMKADGHENVRAEPAMVTKWVRGQESLTLVEPREMPMVLLGLGGSVGTPLEGITAEVVAVPNQAELDRLGEAVRGKIVLFNYAMPPYNPKDGPKYGETVTYRVNGAAWAAKHGAVAALVRSVTARSLRTPHTGGMNYGDAKVKIPGAAITIEDAEMLARFCARGKKPVVRLMMEAKTEGEVESHNVVGEIVGREWPDEIVVISGHLDSWDVGSGAHDDAAGCVTAMQALTTLRRMGLRPRRTIRVVLWTNEENGIGGAKAYVRDHKDELSRHVAAIEADSGGFAPRGFSMEQRNPEYLKKAIERMRRYVAPLAAMKADDVREGGSGADVGQFKAHGVVCLGLNVDMATYFDYHHTPADTPDKVNPTELAQCVAAMALAAYQIAEFGWE